MKKYSVNRRRIWFRSIRRVRFDVYVALEESKFSHISEICDSFIISDKSHRIFQSRNWWFTCHFPRLKHTKWRLYIIVLCVFVQNGGSMNLFFIFKPMIESITMVWKTNWVIQKNMDYFGGFHEIFRGENFWIRNFITAAVVHIKSIMNLIECDIFQINILIKIISCFWEKTVTIISNNTVILS